VAHDDRRDTVEHLADLAGDVRAELGRAPTSVELLALLAWGITNLDEDALLDVEPKRVEGLRASYRRDATPAGHESCEVRELNDAPWEQGSSLVAALARGERQSLDGLLASLVAAFDASDPLLLSDVGPGDIRRLGARLRRLEHPRPKVGDVFAVPARGGTHFLLLTVAKTQVGTAFGVLGRARLPRLPSKSASAALRFPVYCDDYGVLNGEWPNVGHEEELLALFPSEPPVFFRPSMDLPGDVGPHGAAEYPDGELRKLSAAEAQDAGLDRDDFRQLHHSQTLGEWLERRLG
jgi:hypothetical protein